MLLTDASAKSTLAAVRYLSARGVKVHVASDVSLSIAKWSRHAVKRHRVPSSQQQPKRFAAALADLQKLERFDAILPVSDYDIAAMLNHEAIWKSSGAKMALPSRQAFETAWDKSKTMKLARSLGVPFPATWFPDEEPLAEIQEKAKYPVLVKPNISAGARGITMVESPRELTRIFNEVVQRWGPCHVQEWIPEGGAQFKADVIQGANSKLLALFVCRKIRYYPVKGGSSTLIVSQRHQAIEQDVLKIVRGLNWYGFADFDFIVDPRDGQAKLMECNPRFPESLVVNLFSGIDFVSILFDLARTGDAEPAPPYQEGRYARFLVGDVMWFLGSPDRWRAEPSFFKFFDRNLTYYVERWDDPGPTLCYLIEAILTLCSPKKMAYRFSRGFKRQSSLPNGV